MKSIAYKIRLTIAGIVLLLSMFGVFGLFYRIRFLDLQIIPLVQRVLFDFSVISLLLLVCVLMLTVLLGRFYCSTICPLGILQEFVSLLKGKRKNILQKSLGFKYLIAGLVFGTLIGGSALFIRYVDPYTIFGSAFSISLFGVIAAILVLILVFFKNRFFCTNICPVGTVLGLISKLSVNKIYIDKEKCISCGMCANSCPSGCINYKEKSVNNETCVKCLKCLTVCKNDAVKYGVQPINFSPKRRDLLWGIGALAFIGTGYAIGLNFTKNLAKNIRDVFLPAGAVNSNRIANKCLNCNLCINNCPNRILSKANKEFPFIHIDYAQGKRYCEYDCHKCSEVCPSGAIDSIADIVSFAVLYEDINPNKVYFSTLSEGQGTIECQHGTMNVPVPAVCEIASKYKLPLKITSNQGEMITPTGAAIVAALYTGEKLPEEIIFEKIGNGAGKRPYANPILRVIKFK